MTKKSEKPKKSEVYDAALYICSHCHKENILHDEACFYDNTQVTCVKCNKEIVLKYNS